MNADPSASPNATPAIQYGARAPEPTVPAGRAVVVPTYSSVVGPASLSSLTMSAMTSTAIASVASHRSAKRPAT